MRRSPGAAAAPAAAAAGEAAASEPAGSGRGRRRRQRPPVVTANPSIESANARAVNGRDPTYQLAVSGWSPRSSNAFAHFL